MPTLAEALAILEQHYGPQQPTFPTDPYDFLIWWHCGYPASDAACSRGWQSLTCAYAQGHTRGRHTRLN
jgi:hypothetical protein